jgi:hypothetical protein
MSSMNGGNSDNNGSDLDKDNILRPTFDTDGGGSQGVQSLHRLSQRAFPLALRSDTIGDYSPEYYIDCLQQA